MKKLLGIFMLIAGIVIAVTASSATFAYFEAERDVYIEVVPDDNELIDLVPLQPYAFIGEGGVLVIDLSEYNQKYPAGKGKGVSPDSIYVFEHMFGVSNHLWENITICMEITYQGTGGVTFFIGDYVPGVTGDTTLKATILPDEVVKVGMIINSTGIANGTAIEGLLNFYAYDGPCQN